MKKGIVIAISGYSGAGKGTVVNKLKEDPNLNLGVCISATTRAPREGEINGQHYYFISKEEFIQKIENHEFAEYDEHNGNYYGTLISEIENNTKAGKNVLVEIDVNGVENLMKTGIVDTSMFISTPSLEILEQRLRGRGTETEEQIQIRMGRVAYETTKIPLFEHEVINDVLEDTVSNVKKIILEAVEKKNKI